MKSSDKLLGSFAFGMTLAVMPGKGEAILLHFSLRLVDTALGGFAEGFLNVNSVLDVLGPGEEYI